MYDTESGWMIGVEDGMYYDAAYGYQYDGDANELVDLATGNRFDMEYNPVSYVQGKRVYPGASMVEAQQLGIQVPAGFNWDKEGGYVVKPGDAFAGKMYDTESGWMIGVEDGMYYDAAYGYQYDAETNELVDLATGNRFDLEYNPVSVAAE